MPYLINEDTLALIPYLGKTKVLEKDKILTVEESPVNIVSNNCILSGSTLEGRQKGCATLLGSNYKPPIMLDNKKNIILIPTHSSRNKNCMWINLAGIAFYRKNFNNETILFFYNKKKIVVNISFGMFDKQVLRATRLESTIRTRKQQNIL